MSLGALRICGDQQGVCADSGTPGRYRWVSVQEAANGYDTYVDPKRFEAEREHIFRRGVVCSGLSGDLRAANDYRRWEVCGKSILLTRDEGARGRCSEPSRTLAAP